MADLKGMLSFLDGAGKTVKSIHDKLCGLQEHFNKNYNNVNDIRSGELEFLQTEFFADSGRFPQEVRDLYNRRFPEVEKFFDEKLSALKENSKTLEKKLKEADETRKTYAKTLKESNQSLDEKEESLKANIAELEEKIGEYNKTIGELATGFGFFINIFRMKAIEKEKKEILARRVELAERVEAVRNKWVQAEKEVGGKDAEVRETWTTLQTESALITEKIGTLERDRDILIKKGAFYEAVNSLEGGEKFLSLKSQVKPVETCPACNAKNEKNLFFCRYCGGRFAENRPDILGSLVETGELNSVYLDLTEGVKESVSLIALMRGLASGIETFAGSVKNVKSSQDKYSQLPKLKIDVPGFSSDFAGKLADFEKSLNVDAQSLHPQDFAKAMKQTTDKLLTAENIEKFFVLMGDELNARTKEQWK